MVSEDATTVITTPAKTKTRVYGILSLLDRTAAKKAISRNAATISSIVGTRSTAYPFAATSLKLVF
jgi:hypothetical protein